MKPVILGLHIPKCAGTSILKELENNIHHSEIYQSTFFARNYKEGKKEFYELYSLSRLKVISVMTA
jgi:hypothetical protein